MILDIDNLIKDLNIIFKQRGWGEIPLDNTFEGGDNWEGLIIQIERLYLDRNWFGYWYYDSFSDVSLDNYVMEYIKPICKKYKINEVSFAGDDEWEENTIELHNP